MLEEGCASSEKAQSHWHEDNPEEVGECSERDVRETKQENMYDVNDAIELSGWGCYQHKVLLVNGIMNFADAAEIWLAAIIIKNLKCEWGLSIVEEALIPAIVYILYAIGSVISGYLSDKYGRYWVLLINSYLMVVAAIFSAAAPSYTSFILCRSIVGFGIGGNAGCSIMYCQEFTPTKYRSSSMLFLQTYYVLGGAYECVVAIGVMSLDAGWRYQVLLTSLPVLFMLIGMHWMDESPRYLVINERKAEAKEILEKICLQNKVKFQLEGDLFVYDERSGEISDIWAKPNTCGSIQITIHFLCNMFLIYGVSLLVVDMMAYDYCALDQFFNSTYIDSSGCEVYTDAEYLFLLVGIIIYIPGMIGVTVLAEKISRTSGFQVSIFGSLFSTILLLCCTGKAWVTYTELFIVVFFYAAYNEVLWIYTPEFYATYVRGTATGVQNGIGKIGAAAGTFLTLYLDEVGIEYTLWCYVLVIGVACVTSLFMTRETVDVVLQDGRASVVPNDIPRCSRVGPPTDVSPNSPSYGSIEYNCPCET